MASNDDRHGRDGEHHQAAQRHAADITGGLDAADRDRDAGKGNQELGAPNLTDKIWLYGSDEATLIETITNGRAGVMPAWEGRLDPATIKAMAVYVHSLGGGK